ncbi:MAG: hypothetical protein HC925_06125 [Coleofasciculaceae cyanobacterium SM2_3_26]|nr:hypothetical protein [Coleofasciculaceae cyanobacterium SM2_3_26]
MVDTESAIAPPVGAVAAESSVLTDELETGLETGLETELETDLAIDLATDDTDEDLEGVFGLAQGFAQINDASAPSQDKNTGWYLGIDCGTMGLTAVLWHQSSDRFYPIQWFPEAEGEASPRLPLEAYIDTDLQQNPEAPLPSGCRSSNPT